MPVDIVAESSSYYYVAAEQKEVSKHSTLHKAIESAFNAAEKCACVAEINRTLVIKVSTNGKELELSWNHPTKRADGTPLSLDEIQGYEIKLMKLNGPEVIDSKTFLISAKDSYTAPAFDGLNGVAIATIDTNGIKSAFSDIFKVIK